MVSNIEKATTWAIRVFKSLLKEWNGHPVGCITFWMLIYPRRCTLWQLWRLTFALLAMGKLAGALISVENTGKVWNQWMGNRELVLLSEIISYTNANVLIEQLWSVATGSGILVAQQIYHSWLSNIFPWEVYAKYTTCGKYRICWLIMVYRYVFKMYKMSKSDNALLSMTSWKGWQMMLPSIPETSRGWIPKDHIPSTEWGSKSHLTEQNQTHAFIDTDETDIGHAIIQKNRESGNSGLDHWTGGPLDWTGLLDCVWRT